MSVYLLVRGMRWPVCTYVLHIHTTVTYNNNNSIYQCGMVASRNCSQSSHFYE